MGAVPGSPQGLTATLTAVDVIEPHPLGWESVEVGLSVAVPAHVVGHAAVAVGGPHPRLAGPPLAVDLDLDVGGLERFVDMEVGHTATLGEGADGPHVPSPMSSHRGHAGPGTVPMYRMASSWLAGSGWGS